MIPLDRPRLSSSELDRMLPEIDRQKWPLLFGGIRGYYAKSMGGPGNDRMIYDDCIFIYSANSLTCFNGNVDPNGFKKGKGTGEGKGFANLKAGFWPAYKFDLHKGQYLALCQRAAAVTVTRDGDPPYTNTGWFGINIHRGGISSTSSLGCQTIPPVQWDAFISLA